VILVSWLIAFFEYCLQVPANRLGYGQFTVAQLKIVHEVITLVVFARHFLVHLAESHLTQRLFGQILWRIERLAWHPT